MMPLLVRVNGFLERGWLNSFHDLGPDETRGVLRHVSAFDLSLLRRACKSLKSLSDEEVKHRVRDVSGWINSLNGEAILLDDDTDGRQRSLVISRIEGRSGWTFVLDGVFNGHLHVGFNGYQITVVTCHRPAGAAAFYVVNVVSNLSSSEDIVRCMNETKWGGLSPGIYVSAGEEGPNVTLKSDEVWQSGSAAIGSEFDASKVRGMFDELIGVHTGDSYRCKCDDSNSENAYFQTYLRTGDVSINGSFHFTVDSCRSAWFWVRSTATGGNQGFVYRSGITSVDDFRNILHINWTDWSKLDIYYAM